MRKSLEWALVLLLWTACRPVAPQARKSGGPPMTAPPGTPSLTVASRGSVKLVPEQGAVFDLTLRNGGTPAEMAALDGNQFTPVLRVFDAAGKLVLQATPRNLFQRFSPAPRSGFQVMDSVPPRPTMVTMAPGQELTSWFNLFNHADPLPKGRYTLEVSHRPQPDGTAVVTGNRVAFEVEDARVSEAALSYQSSARRQSVMAWIAAPEDGGPPRLLLRLSTLYRHSTAMDPGNQVEEAPPGTRLALSAGPSQRLIGRWSWLGVTRPGQAVVMKQFEGRADWRSAAIALPGMKDPLPVPGFPDREEHAVFLATGVDETARRPVLAGAVVNPEQPGPPRAWSVPLKYPADATACIFGRTGEIAVLLLAQGEPRSRLARIEVQEDGAIFAAESEVRDTDNQVVAICADQREHQRPGFFVLEASRRQPGRLTVIAVPPRGTPEVRDLGAVEGWPKTRLARVFLTTSWQGVPLVALVDEEGHFLGGPLDGSPLRRLDRDGGPRVLLPHIAALGQGPLTFAGFTGQGGLAYLAGLGR